MQTHHKPTGRCGGRTEAVETVDQSLWRTAFIPFKPSLILRHCAFNVSIRSHHIMKSRLESDMTLSMIKHDLGHGQASTQKKRMKTPLHPSLTNDHSKHNPLWRFPFRFTPIWSRAFRRFPAEASSPDVHQLGNRVKVAAPVPAARRAPSLLSYAPGQ